MIGGRAAFVLSTIFFICVFCSFSFGNACANNGPSDIDFNIGETCWKRPADTNKNEVAGAAYFNLSYPCDNNTLDFFLPASAKNYTIEGAVNPQGALSVTVTEERNRSILVIKIVVSDNPYDEMDQTMRNSLRNLIGYRYPITSFQSYYKTIGDGRWLVAESNTTDPDYPVFGAIYIQSCKGSNSHKWVSIKTWLNKRDFDELIETFKLRDERCD